MRHCSKKHRGFFECLDICYALGKENKNKKSLPAILLAPEAFNWSPAQ